MDAQIVDLSVPCKQSEFGALVGVSQQAISDLVARGVLQPGQASGQWLHAYAAHLREQAAGRGADGQLAANRAEESRVRREKLELELAEMRREVASVVLIDQVLAHIGAQIRATLEPLHVTLKMRCPNLTAEDLRIVQDEVFRACNLAANLSLASLDAFNAEDDGAPTADAPEPPPLQPQSEVRYSSDLRQ